MKINKRLFHTIPVVLIMLFGTIPIAAQIQITWPVPTMYKTFSVDIDTIVDVRALDLSRTGGPLAWNFDIDQLWSKEIETKTLAETPYNGTAGLENTDWVYYYWMYLPAIEYELTPTWTLTLEDQLTEMYVFRTLNNGTIQELGLATDYDILQGSPFVYDTPSDVFPHPLTWNSPGWTETRVFHPTVNAFGLQLTGTVTDNTHIEVNAYGTVTLPTGTYDCLQLKRHEFREIQTNQQGLIPAINETIESYSYMWLTNSYDLVMWVMSFDDQAVFDTADVVIIPTEPVPVECDPECSPDNNIPKTYVLGQNYPNPFNPTTSIKYALPAPSRVELNVFTILGQNVAVLESGMKQPGEHIAVWDGRDRHGKQVPGGVYFYQMRTTPLNGGETTVQTKKMVMTK